MLLLGHLLPPGARSEILKPHAIHRWHRLHNNDPGAAHHHRAAAARRLQEIGPNCYCRQPGETLNLQSSINEKFMLHITLTLGFCCWLWGTVCAAAPNICLQCGVSLFKKGGQRAFPQTTWAALLGQERDPWLVAVTWQAATNSLHWRESSEFLAAETSWTKWIAGLGQFARMGVFQKGLWCLNLAVACCCNQTQVQPSETKSHGDLRFFTIYNIKSM